MWLLTGPASVYKVFSKEVTEQRPFNSATIEQQIATKEKYALEYNGTLFFIKKLKEVPAILANKKRELEAFLNLDQILNAANTDDQFVLLVNYYNSVMR